MEANEILITDLSDPRFHGDKVLTRLKQPFLLASLITKDPEYVYVLLCHLDRDIRKRINVQATITGLGGTVWEPLVPSPESAFKGVRECIDLLGPEQVSMRYDPIIPGVNDKTAWFQGYFKKMVEVGVSKVTCSIIDLYPHSRARMSKAGVNFPSSDTVHYPSHIRDGTLRRFVRLAKECEIEVRICCEVGFVSYQKGGCDWIIDALDRVYGEDGYKLLEGGTQRKLCGCPKMSQILSYQDKCEHGCLYCYRKEE